MPTNNGPRTKLGYDNMYRPPSRNFHATYSMMSLCHLILSALVIMMSLVVIDTMKAALVLLENVING